MQWIALVSVVLYAIFFIARKYGVLENSVGVDEHKEKVREREKSNKQRKKERSKLAFYGSVSTLFGGLLLSASNKADHKFIISRLDLRSKILDRLYTPEELRGKYCLFAIVGVACIPLSVFIKPLLIITVATFIIFSFYKRRYLIKIQDEDDIIDVYFIDLFLLLYSRLRMGSKGRLATVVKSYIDTLKSMDDCTMQIAMLKLSQFLINNLTMYPDHVAVPILIERYKSAVVVNFCNVATQALQGIDNSDTLLTFKLDLMKRKSNLMKENAEKLRVKGNRAIYLIWVILFVFILVGWYSKLPTGFF